MNLDGSLLLSWLLTFLLHSTLLLALAALISDRLRSELVRERLWKACLLGSLLSASLQPVLVGTPLGGRFLLGAAESAPARGDAGLELDAATLAALLAAQEATPRELATAEREDAVLDHPGLAPTALLAWSLGGLLAVLTFALGTLQLRRHLSDREWIGSGPLREALDELERQAGLRRRVALYRSPSLTSPLATGFLRPRICVPARSEDLPPAARRVMLAHELAHIVRRDPLWQTFARGLETLFLVQPFLRLARRRLEEASEFLCDARAVQWTGEPVALAECLTEVAGWVVAGRRPAALACGMASRRSPLARRVERILGTPHEERGAWRGSVLAGALVAGTVLVAPAVTRPGEPQRDEVPGPVSLLGVPLAPRTIAPIASNRESLAALIVSLESMESAIALLHGELDALGELADDEAARARLLNVRRRLDGLLGRRERVLNTATQLLETTGGTIGAPLPEQRTETR